MAHSKQAKKRIKTDEQSRLENKAVMGAVRSSAKKVLKAKSPEEARKNLAEAIKRVDKAAKKGVIHENKAARQKRRLSRAASEA